jgi:hypothetical protein
MIDDSINNASSSYKFSASGSTYWFRNAIQTPDGTTLPGYTGLSMRDYFAAKAMQAEFSTLYAFSQFEDCARSAYLMADAMLKERNKQHDTK